MPHTSYIIHNITGHIQSQSHVSHTMESHNDGVSQSQNLNANMEPVTYVYVTGFGKPIIGSVSYWYRYKYFVHIGIGI